MRAPASRRRLALGGFAWWLVVAVVVRTVVALPERCPPAPPARVDEAVARAIGWFARNQEGDGTWLYRYRAADDVDLGGYNLPRHAGVALSLYQAAARGRAAAYPVAEAGTGYALERLVEVDLAASAGLAESPGPREVPGPGRAGAEQGLAFGAGPQLDTGASALLVNALVERRRVPGRPAGERVSHDEALAGLGRFLVALVQPSGAVPASWLVGTGPSVGAWSRFYTGEVFWALSRLAGEFPEAGFGEVAGRVGRYLAGQRDEVEGWFPPIADHWGAYGLNEQAQLPVGAPGRLGEGDLENYAERVASLVGVQVRYESQRTDSLPSRFTRGRRTLGAGLGTLGEALGNLVPVAAARPDLAELREPIEERAECVAGMLLERQTSAEEAAALPDPGQAEGAWFQFGVTQMDDQQHALSALLLLPEGAGS
ncbi:MAG: hypothetical protein GEV08_13725 [Acidimicrobiia bacterium]|nr:hypothetical protein [Acidimicrobiia bacterium]